MANQIAVEIEEFKWEPDAMDTKYFGKHIPEEDRVPNEELSSIEANYKYLKVIANRFDKNDEWIEIINDLRNYHILKFPQIVQALLFFTGSLSKDICLPNTNKMHWKTVRQMPNSFFSKSMVDYQILGQTRG